MSHPLRPVPCIRVTDTENEYLVFINEERQIDNIVQFPHGRRIGNQLTLDQIPWSARWQIEQEMTNLIP